MTAALRSMPKYFVARPQKSRFRHIRTRKGEYFPSGLSLNDRFGEI
ncbi:MAG: hypothetical protein PHD65_00320 [Gallionella sp.]|nr:hypothetical protein [Gallionella sp.]